MLPILQQYYSYQIDSEDCLCRWVVVDCKAEILRTKQTGWSFDLQPPC